MKRSAELFSRGFGIALLSFGEDGFPIDSHPRVNFRFDFVHSRKTSLHIFHC